MIYIKRDIYPIELIKTGILLLPIVSINPRRGYYPYNAVRAMVLYCLHPLLDGYLPLNREYKPLGISRYREWVPYEGHEHLIIPKDRIDLSALKNKTFTFDDGSFPDNAKDKKRYKNIINKLFKNEIDFDEYMGYE